MMSLARGAGVGFALTVYAIDALPCPLLSPEIDTHDEPLTTVHGQSRVVDTVTVPEPPDDANDAGAFESWTLHRASVGAVVTAVSLEVQKARKNGDARRAIAGTKAENRRHIERASRV